MGHPIDMEMAPLKSRFGSTYFFFFFFLQCALASCQNCHIHEVESLIHEVESLITKYCKTASVQETLANLYNGVATLLYKAAHIIYNASCLIKVCFYRGYHEYPCGLGTCVNSSAIHDTL